MTFETLTVIELLLSASNYPEDKCDKIRDELSTMDKKAKAFNEVIKKVETEFVSEDLADSIRILVNDYEYDMEEK